MTARRPGQPARPAARDGPTERELWHTAYLRNKIVDSRGFDSSRILMLRGGILTSIGNFPEVLSQQILAGIILGGRSGALGHPVEVSFRPKTHTRHIRNSQNSKNFVLEVASTAQHSNRWTGLTGRENWNRERGSHHEITLCSLLGYRQTTFE